ncbi:hypothetical protein IE53DRAFT_368200 [Violaceomyces palustris]|uniref:Uncharacterized protein n=1 Tax=Violaceomyces palustris TaxID=1673888 RepID=A0ACD0NZM5_9BASI|nr:hypothetical protein IE53DRAFT_368200 [Violaceomyces palustris]
MRRQPPSNGAAGTVGPSSSTQRVPSLSPLDGSGDRVKADYGALSSSPPPIATAETVPASGTKPARVLAPDLLRGLLMVLQSLDHSALFLGAWRHGVAKESEADGKVMHEWNTSRAWTSRMLTHLCAPGFMFLLGMGAVYFGRSRSRLGWSKLAMAGHFAKRSLAIFGVNQLLGLLLIGRKLWITNIVLVALSVNYLVAGLLWLGVQASEKRFEQAFNLYLGGGQSCSQEEVEEEEEEEEEQPLLEGGLASRLIAKRPSFNSESLSWSLHSLILLLLAAITLWWNVWLSPDGGKCPNVSEPNLSSVLSRGPSLYGSPIQAVPLMAGTLDQTGKDGGGGPGSIGGKASSLGPWFDFWFYPVQNDYVLSVFPPLAWLSFAIFGILYARIVLLKRWSDSTIAVGNLIISSILATLFVLTRILHFGNLSENCLKLPEQVSHPGGNQYLASWRSFLYVTKYPPSPSFLFLTMSVNHLLLAIFHLLPPKLATRSLPGLLNFGSSALFFYAAHILVYMLLAVPAKRFFSTTLPDPDPVSGQPTYGLGDSAAFWGFWILGLVILGPICTRYAKFKASKPLDSVWRFF